MRKDFLNSTAQTLASYRWLLFALIFAAVSIRTIRAQVASTYTFSNGSATFTSIQGGGGTVTTNTGADDVQYGGLPIGFNFYYNGSAYTSFMYSTNGYLQLGANTASGYVPLASFANIISGMGGDLLGLATNGSAMMYETSGTAPNRILTLEWKNWGFNNAGATSADFDLQIKLYETSGNIQILYNPLLVNAETTVSTPAGVVQVGLSGSSPADFNSRTTSTNWASTTPAGSVAPGVAEMTYSLTVRPLAGSTYNFTPVSGCLPPLIPPSALNFSSIGDTYATVGYSPASGVDSYLTVRYPAGATPTTPNNGVIYSLGDPLGTGIVVGNTVSNSVPLTALTPATTYDIYVYSENQFCVGGPLFLAAPLMGTFSTLAPPATTTWLGATGGADNWQIPGNWSTSVPNGTIAVTIPPAVSVAFPPNIATAGVVNSLLLQNGAYINVTASATLNIKGGIVSDNGSIKGLGTAILSGTASQVVSGNLTLNNANITNTSGAGVSVAVGATVRVEPTVATGSGIVTFGNSAKFTNSGKFILGSNSIATAKIGPIPTVAPNAATISGNVTVERYLPNQGSGSGSWYFIGSPVSGQNFNDFADNFSVTGLSPGGFGDQGGNIHPSPEPERSTIFEYVEASHNVHLDTVQKNGWRIPGNVNVVPGVGYRVWVNYQSNSTHKFDNTGPIAIGDNVDGSYQLPVLTRNEYTPCYPSTPSYDPNECNESNRGWNLLSNPFPCDIDWDSPGWNKPVTLNNAFITWNSALSGYRVYVGSGGVSLGVVASTTPNPNLIASGQGFFVRRSVLKAGSAIAVKETGKTTSTSAVFTRPAVEAVDQMAIELRRLEDADDYRFVSMLRIREDATEAFDDDFDSYGLTGARPHIAFPIEGDLLVLNTLGPITLTTHVPMRFQYGGQQGTFKFTFTDAASFENVGVYLKDNYLNSITETTNGTYTFTVDSNPESQSPNRFELLVNPGVATVTPNSSLLSGLSVYPNPSLAGKGTTFVLNGFDAETATLVITDALGKVVFRTTVNLVDKAITEYLMTTKLSGGIYSVKATGGSRSFALKLAVR